MQNILSDAELQLLNMLVQNSQYTPAIIGQAIGKSRNWVSHAIKELVKKGIIKSYTTILNPSLVQTMRIIILFMKSNPREQDVSTKLIEMEELESLDGIAGDFSLVGLFRYDSQGVFENLLDRVDRVVASSIAGKFNLVQVLTTYKKNRFKILSSETPQSPLSRKELDLIKIIYRYQPIDEDPFPLTQEKIGKMMDPELSQPAVSKTIDRLTLNRAIVGHSIDIDYSLIGLPIKFFVRIKVSPGTASGILKELLENDQVWDLYRTSEDYSLLATVRTNSVGNYNQFLRTLYENSNVLDTESYISLEEWFIPFR